MERNKQKKRKRNERFTERNINAMLKTKKKKKSQYYKKKKISMYCDFLKYRENATFVRIYNLQRAGTSDIIHSTNM